MGQCWSGLRAEEELGNTRVPINAVSAYSCALHMDSVTHTCEKTFSLTNWDAVNQCTYRWVPYFWHPRPCSGVPWLLHTLHGRCLFGAAPQEWAGLSLFGQRLGYILTTAKRGKAKTLGTEVEKPYKQTVSDGCQTAVYRSQKGWIIKT
jgi:hypothetical protein